MTTTTIPSPIQVKAGCAARSREYRFLTYIAFLLTISIPAARLLMTETVRNVGDAFPGQTRPPLGPSAVTALILDLVAWLPAMLILTRRVLDPGFRIRWSWSCFPMILLGLMAVVSTAWSADKFGAVVSSITWISALALLWSAFQLITCSRRLRAVAGLCIGLLIALVATGYFFRLVEWPELEQNWHEHQQEVLKEHHWTVDSFDARQFEKRVMSGEILGFSTSPNTYAALLVLLGTVTAGVAADKWKQHSGKGKSETVGLVLCAILILASIPALIWAESRGAAGTALIAAALLALFLARGAPIQRPRSVYWTAVTGFVLCCIALVGHGLYYQTLFHPSLTFRWRYWVGASRMVALHPWLGVGWENFGPSYLGVRLPAASEEIRDPHNFIVRITSELGFVGGLLLLAWMLRVWWEMTLMRSPSESMPTENPVRQKALRWVGLIALTTIAINVLASVDFGASYYYLVLEIVGRFLFLGCLLGGLSLAVLRIHVERKSRQTFIEPELDNRPAPWILLAIFIGLGMFLIHNLIDFALFEPGPMFLFALLVGSALGVGERGKSPVDSKAVAAGTLLFSGAAWLFALIVVVLPIASAETLSHDADDAVRANQPRRAVQDLRLAFQKVPWDGDYAYRAAILARAAGENENVVRSLLDAAIAADPSAPGYFLARAHYTRETHPDDHQAIRADLEKAIALDPNSVSIRLQLARVMEQMHDYMGADWELKSALSANAGMDPAEPKRLKPEEVQALRKEIEALWKV